MTHFLVQPAVRKHHRLTLLAYKQPTVLLLVLEGGRLRWGPAGVSRVFSVGAPASFLLPCDKRVRELSRALFMKAPPSDLTASKFGHFRD